MLPTIASILGYYAKFSRKLPSLHSQFPRSVFTENAVGTKNVYLSKRSRDFVERKKTINAE